MIEPIIGDPGDEQFDAEARPMNWYRDDEGYLWPTAAEGRVLDDPSEDED